MRQWVSPIVFLALVALSVSLTLAQTSGVTVTRQPVNIVRRSFDPARPPEGMPHFSPDETAECDSDFLSAAVVAAQARQTDATHATATVTQIGVTLHLKITIWLPNDVTQHVAEHEEGHRQISEYYYQNAAKVAGRVTAPYMGKQFVITGANLRTALSKSLQKMDDDITNQYNKEVTPQPAQLRFDALTDHSRNDVIAKDAVAQVLKEMPPLQ